MPSAPMASSLSASCTTLNSGVISAGADELESFLDDYGARTNRTFSAFAELVASIRGFALAGMKLAHLDRRLDSYGVADRMPGEGFEVLEHVREAHGFVEGRMTLLMEALLEEILYDEM